MPTPQDRDEEILDDETLTNDQDQQDDDDELDIDEADLTDDSDEDADSADKGEDDDSDESDDDAPEPKPKPKPKPKQTEAPNWEKIARTAIAQRDHWKTKATKSLKPSERPAAPKSQKQQTNTDPLTMERFEFRQDFPQLRRSEVDEIEAYARGKGISLYEAATTPFVKTFLKIQQKKRSIASASVDSGHRSKPATPDKDVASMSLAEIEKAAARRVQRSLERDRK